MSEQVGSIHYSLDLDKKDFDKGIEEAKSSIGGFDKTLEDMTNSSKKLAVGAAAVGTGVGFALKQSVDQARAFETSMADISTLISGDSTDAVKELSDQLLELSKRMPNSIDELGGPLYDILSAGVQGSANQMLVLESSAKLATAGLGDTKGATDLMTSAINAFGLEAGDANEIADVIFKTVKNGKTTVDQLAMSFGATAPVLSAAGITLSEFSAATAALTTTGLPASQAQNGLRQATVALTKPTKEMSELFAKLGFESGAAAVENIGLVDTMIAVTDAADGNSEMLAKAWGSVEALGASTALTGQVSESFTNTIKDMTEGANSLDEAFEKQKGTFDSSMQLLKNNIDAIVISIGSQFLPALVALSTFLAENVAPTIDKLSNFLIENQDALKALAIGITAMLVPALVSWSVAAGAAAIATLIAAAPLIALGAAVAGLAFLVIKNWDRIKFATEVLKSSFSSMVNFLGRAMSRVFDVITKPFRQALEAITRVASRIKEQMNKLNPFARFSPSLVEQVKKGVGLIQSEFSTLSDISMNPVAHSFEPGQMGGTNMTTVNVGQVNEKSDIDMITRELGFRSSLAI